MQQDTSAIILTEIRELRSDLNEFSRKSGERLAALERDNYQLMGNGQPGKIAHMEKNIERLQQWRKYVLGYIAGGSVVVGGVISFIVWVLKS